MDGARELTAREVFRKNRCGQLELRYAATDYDNMVPIITSYKLLKATCIILMQWSFGVTCWETFSGGDIPYPEIQPSAMVRYLESGQRLHKPINQACKDEE